MNEHALASIEFKEPGLQRAICQCGIWKGPWREFIPVAEHDILWHIREEQE
jgi:hypothetical protein